MRVEECRVGGAREERRVPQDVDQQVTVRGDAVQPGPGQRIGQDRGGPGSRRRVGDDLGEHRVVEDRHDRSVDDAGVQPNPRVSEQAEFGSRRGYLEVVDGTGLRLPVLGGILGVEPHLDGMPARCGRLGVQGAARRDEQLQFHQVEAGGLLGDRVLDLKAGVHLEEEEIAFVVGHELDGACARVADRLRGQPCGFEELGAHARNAFDERRRRFLDDLLVAALNRALAFADGPHRAVCVGHHLNLDVVSGGEVALAEHRRVTERGLCLALSRLDLLGQFGEVGDDAHATPTASRRGLDEHWKLFGGNGFGVELLEHGYARCGHHLLGLDLAAHGLHRRDRRPDPGEPRLLDGRREFGVLREESVARVDGVGARRLCGVDQLCGVEVAGVAGQADPDVGLGDVGAVGVGFGVHGDRGYAEAATRREHAAGDLPAIGDQNARDHRLCPRDLWNIISGHRWKYSTNRAWGWGLGMWVLTS